MISESFIYRAFGQPCWFFISTTARGGALTTCRLPWEADKDASVLGLCTPVQYAAQDQERRDFGGRLGSSSYTERP